MAGDSAQASTQASVKDSALEATVARLDADLAALKASLEHNSKTTTGQFNKANDRLDKVEKAQAEPAAKLAKLTDAVDKLRAAQASATTAAAVPAPAKEKEVTVTGTVPQQAAAAAPPAASPAPPAPPKPEVARLPTVEGWVLRDVANGSALIESRRGMYEVYAGDPIPGLGRVDAIRKQDGRWVVVTSKGLIVAR
jgi:peptidoglycan hydrolase-like protein with peptidoglycan-binding domain